jgi:hypothetical protein
MKISGRSKEGTFHTINVDRLSAYQEVLDMIKRVDSGDLEGLITLESDDASDE